MIFSFEILLLFLKNKNIHEYSLGFSLLFDIFPSVFPSVLSSLFNIDIDSSLLLSIIFLLRFTFKLQNFNSIN